MSVHHEIYTDSFRHNKSELDLGEELDMGNTENMKNYAEYLTEAELSERTKEIYVREAMRLEEYLSDSGITKKRLIEYKMHMESLCYAATTQNLHIVAVNRYLRYLGHPECVLKTNRMQGRQSLQDILTVKEYKMLLHYAKESGREKYYVIMRTLAMTGIRIGELKYFTSEVLDKEAILVTNKKKTREICMPDKLIEELRLYCSHEKIESGSIFQGRQGSPINRTTVYKMLRHLADMTGIAKSKVHPHNFRHLFALTYMENYANLFELADLLGHSSLETTRIYVRSTMKEKRQRINELGL